MLPMSCFLELSIGNTCLGRKISVFSYLKEIPGALHMIVATIHCNCNTCC